MDVKAIRRGLRYPGMAALFVALALSAHATVVGQDSFETSNFSTIWSQTEGVTIQKSGGARATGGFARLKAAGGKLEGDFAAPGDSSRALADFSIEFFLRMQNGEGRLHLQIEGAGNSSHPELTLGCDAKKGWGISSGTSGASWRAIAGLKPITAGAWYRVRLVGRDWGQTNARCTLQISDAAGSAFTTPSIRLDGLSTSMAQPARQFALNNIGGNSAVDVDEVSLVAITPYKGAIVRDVDTKTLFGKVMCGYQGWFGAPGDGSSERGWRHWTKGPGPLADGNAKVDLWPDVSELDPGQRFATGFKMANGSPAEVFSSFQRPTVLKHFEWMQDYGIDGVFVQRFAADLQNPGSLEHCNAVLANCRAGANLHGRAYAVMYDLSGLPAGKIDTVINDWRALRNQMVITEDPAYLDHRGKPVVAVWGIGFNDHRNYTLAECRRLIDFLKNDPEVGGCTVMLGVPSYWRTLNRDAVSDPALLDIAAMADIISPWTVGRYTTPAAAARYAETTLKLDQAWCGRRGIDLLPVVFPGFSWHNMKGDPSDQIPREHGRFLWSQFCGAKRDAISMVYVAMFDEVDEGTAIFKCVNDVPTGEKSKFVTWEGLPSDFYLKMVGAGTKLIRGETSLDTRLSSQR
jgi:hypothetical protein